MTTTTPSPSVQAVTEALQGVVDPNTGKDFVSTRQLRELRVEGGDVSFDVELGYPAPPSWLITIN